MAKHKRVSLEQKRESNSTAVELPNGPIFPHRLHLEDKDIEKLGLADLELGDERELGALVRVTDISSHEDKEDGKRRSMTLVLVEGEITQPIRSQAERVFGGRDGGDK